ncbi:MAG: methyl-accepting chemotaxis protein [Candidatus Omnitrophica bacterium]|nr:methyl-accepting chemotaxis protein [Candidatus Omnitrophota bacterium]
MRVKFITKNPLQRKYLVLILSSIMIPLFLAGGCFYYIMFQIMAEQLAIPESIAYNLIPVFHKINFLLIIGLTPTVVLLFILGVFLTHRLIGPLERLEDDLKKISQGDYTIRLKIRKDDDLRSIADVINKIIDMLEKK